MQLPPGFAGPQHAVCFSRHGYKTLQHLGLLLVQESRTAAKTEIPLYQSYITMNDCNYSIKQIVSLLDEETFKWEIRAYKRAYQRLKIRFRNNFIIASLKQIVVGLKDLETKLPSELFKKLGDRANQLTDLTKRRKCLGHIRKITAQLIKSLDDVLDKSIHVYSKSQSQLRVGHLVHHWIVIRTSLARIRIFLKALLVYASDLYFLLAFSQLTEPTKEEVEEILKKNDIQLKTIEPIADPKAEEVQVIQKNKKDELIGQLIDRKTLQPVVTRIARPRAAKKNVNNRR